MRIFHVLLVTFMLLLGVTPLHAQSAGAFGSEETRIAARLVAESAAPEPGGSTTLAFVMTPEPGWHGYWENPGDAGLGMTVKWTLPAGIDAGPLRYPVPETLMIAGLMNHVYEGPYAVLTTLAIPAGLKPGTHLPIRVRADWLACTDKVCVPDGADLSLDLVVGDGRTAPAARTAFDGYRATLPRPLGSPASYAIDKGVLRLAIPYPAAAALEDAHVFPLNDRLARYAAPQKVTRDGDRLLIETEAGAGAGASGAQTFVLRTGDQRGFLVKAVPGPVATPSLGGWTTLLLVLGGAVLGGLILNIMPCVFPILGLKALSLARTGGDERTVRGEALAYVAGVILACLALGGLLLALRAGGAAIGWAFQLQDPRIILLLLLLVTGIALNLAGLYELRGFGGGQGLAAQGGRMGAFWTGALVAFVATPCTGPFMGAALGAALVLPLAAALLVFAGLGLGLALPFVLIAYVPALRARLPRPGGWMARVQKILSLPMFATALGLAWLLGQQRGVSGMTLGLAATLGLGLLLWWLGARQRAGRGGWAVALIGGALCLAIAASLLPQTRATASASTQRGIAFDETRLASLRAAGKPVFLYFTADWCLTCKANEAAAIDRAETASAFERAGVTVMVGDWTTADPAITRFLEAQGRSGVPLYLWYAPGKEARTLPQLLTVATLTDLVR